MHVKLASVFLSVILFLVSGAAMASWDNVTPLTHLLDNFKLKSTFEVNNYPQTKASQPLSDGRQIEYRMVGGKEYSICYLERHGNVVIYSANAVGSAGSSILYIDELSMRIVAIEYVVSMIKPAMGSKISYYSNLDTYNTDFEQLLPVITSRYGLPIKEGYVDWLDNSYRNVYFHEAGKYEYEFGVLQDGPGYPSFKLIIRAL